MALEEEWWQEKKGENIEIVGVDADDIVAANRGSHPGINAEQGTVYPVRTAPVKSASNPDVEPRAQLYGFSWNGFDNAGELFECRDSKCKYCARQREPRWHGFGTEAKAIGDKDLTLLEANHGKDSVPRCQVS